MSLNKNLLRFCAGTKSLHHAHKCLHGSKQIVGLNAGVICSVQCVRRLSSDSTVDAKTKKVPRKSYGDKNIKKMAGNQPQVCLSL